MGRKIHSPTMVGGYQTKNKPQSIACVFLALVSVLHSKNHDQFFRNLGPTSHWREGQSHLKLCIKHACLIIWRSELWTSCWFLNISWGSASVQDSSPEKKAFLDSHTTSLFEIEILFFMGSQVS